TTGAQIDRCLQETVGPWDRDPRMGRTTRTRRAPGGEPFSRPALDLITSSVTRCRHTRSARRSRGDAYETPDVARSCNRGSGSARTPGREPGDGRADGPRSH